ncbi:hypothetical protein H8S45_07935 [Agathobaculum sp. NSJ-28]|uniref:Uncharacterized protein n=1 Tax=Agathobaculum faecis TaxID=2763013 RepID=A0A923LW48_9FIRM|nr:MULTISPECIES: hypothetical protein [Agathobaculum]MBC5725387.1 hypothetical protein [Agathobaculum faecis]MBS6881857.1 hypothetical protein [Clostridiaceae bacterium]
MKSRIELALPARDKDGNVTPARTSRRAARGVQRVKPPARHGRMAGAAQPRPHAGPPCI